MIRVPISTVPEALPNSPRNEPPVCGSEPESGARKAAAIEARLDHLELRLVEHAEGFKGEILERVERIQGRLENAMKPFLADGETGNDAENVVEFDSGEKDLHHLHVNNAREALNELNRTLRHSLEHLEALGNSVERMKRAVKS
ncbi:MAG: hypothetical protein WD342_00465 [Verrucomicrobiales bacterium]